MTNDPYDGESGEHFDISSPPNRGPISGVDPRIAALKDKPIMHTQPQSEVIRGKEPVYGSLTNLIDRLEHTYSYLSGLNNNMIDLNNKLGGPVPQEDDSKHSPDKPGNCLAIAHALVTDIDRRLQQVESEIKRLHNNIGE